jgi:hypothetical protein
MAIRKAASERQKAKGKRQKAKISDVERVLQGYANRGVFRAFTRSGTAFRFTWLWNLPFRASFRAGILEFPELLPGIPVRSRLERELRKFIRECCAADRPEHRRVDPARVGVKCVRKKSAIGLAFKIQDEYGVRAAINLINEIFLSFLNVEHASYVVAQFRVPED